MPVMEIGIVRVPMHERPMPVSMAMWFAWRIVRSVRMPMVLVMRVPMLVLHDLVCMFVLVAFGQV